MVDIRVYSDGGARVSEACKPIGLERKLHS